TEEKTDAFHGDRQGDGGQRSGRDAERGAAHRDDELQRGTGEGWHHAGRRRPAATRQGRPRPVRRAAANRRRRSLPRGTRPRPQFDGPNRTVADGPFAETKELVAGYWIWEVRSLEEAIEWVKRCPNPMPGPSEIEIRPLYDMEDFGEIVTPEIREQEQRLRAESERLAKK